MIYVSNFQLNQVLTQLDAFVTIILCKVLGVLTDTRGHMSMSMCHMSMSMNIVPERKFHSPESPLHFTWLTLPPPQAPDSLLYVFYLYTLAFVRVSYK